MPIRPHGSGYEVRVQSGGKRLSKTFRLKRDAFEWEAKVRGRIADSQLGRTPKYTLAEAIARWLEGEARTLKSYPNLVHKVRALYPYVGRRLLTESVAVAEQAKSAYLSQGLMPATVNRRLAILRRVCNLAYRRWQWIDRPIGDQISLLPGEARRNVSLTPDQVQKLAKCATKPVADAIMLAAMSGLRKGELLRLTPADRKDGCLYVRESKSGKPRVVPLPPEALKIRLPLALDASKLSKGFQKARGRARMYQVRFHDLRHCYGTWLAQANVPLASIRDLLGHADITTTSRYLHSQPGHLREAVSRLPRLSGAKTGTE